MSSYPYTPRYALFPQLSNGDDDEGRRRTVRRYKLAPLHLPPKAAGEERYAYLKRGHD
jgi:hypothetical protein